MEGLAATGVDNPAAAISNAADTEDTEDTGDTEEMVKED